MAIRGLHAMIYTPKAAELREFFRDRLGLGYFDAGDNWLIFQTPEVELGCHPAEGTAQDISFYCDDINKTVADLRSKGVQFIGDIEDHGYGLVTHFLAPGGMEIQLYEPRYRG